MIAPTMQAVMLYLMMSATLCALRTVTTVLFCPGAATRGAVAAPTVRFRLMAVDRLSPSAKSLICTHSNSHHLHELHSGARIIKDCFWQAHQLVTRDN